MPTNFYLCYYLNKVKYFAEYAHIVLLLFSINTENPEKVHFENFEDTSTQASLAAMNAAIEMNK